MRTWNWLTITLAAIPLVLAAWVAPILLAAPADTSSYKRSLWPHWTDEDSDCQDTRAEVLIRDSVEPVLFRDPETMCTVARGRWIDPYTGETHRDPARLDVDHLVPLKQAHDSGGLAWPRARKTQYANHLGYRWHLVAVAASENRKKGSRGPDQYRPPRREFWCRYAESWGATKTAWGLRATPAERAALLEMLATCPS